MAEHKPILRVNSAAINAYKDRAQLTDTELAERVGMSRNSVIRFRQSDCEISATGAASLTLALGGSINDWTYPSTNKNSSTRSSE